eukprot:GHVO01000946.1.p1 GENE.GHVO01000946.1~~GHVO01000946.1.p1  ORF type:complete len:417 (+),score=18.11 GHVO01000946.1:1-1251(+)
MYIGYTVNMLSRKSFSFALPAIIQDGLDKDDLGLISSSQNLAYTFSKFLGGVMSDSISSRLLFSVGLFLSGVVTLVFTGFSSAYAFAALWFLQGLVQGGGWPACAKMLKNWFSPTVLGTWYSILNTTMNLACSVGPLLSAFLIARSSWRWCMSLYGIITMVVAVVGFFFLVNSPTDVGFESFGDDAPKKDNKGKVKGRGRGTWQEMIKSPFMWVMCVSYLVVFLARTAALDWGQLYLIQELNQSEYIGSLFISSLEMGGIIGSVAAGYIADKMVAMSRREDTKGSPRMTVTLGFVILFTSALHLFLFHVNSTTPQVVIMIIGFIIGFGLYGPISLYGVMAIEAAPSHLTGTSHAIVSLAANIGAILAGLPFSYLAKQFEWKGAFIVLEALSIGVIIMKVITRNLEYKVVLIKKKMQ